MKLGIGRLALVTSILIAIASSCGEGASFNSVQKQKATNTSADATAAGGSSSTPAGDAGGTTPGSDTDRTAAGGNVAATAAGSGQSGQGTATDGSGATGSVAGASQSTGSSTSSNSGTGTGTTPPTAQQVAQTCANSTHKQVTTTVSFPDPKQVCAWGVGGNLPALDGTVTARREQVVPLTMPDGAIICDLDFQFSQQTMRYDDEVFLTLDNVILAASQDYSALFGTSGDFVTYDWTKLVGAKYGHNLHPQYCLGAATHDGTCMIPETETTGTMSLQFNEDIVHELSAYAIAQKAYNLQWVTIGDNDSTDCQHSDFSFGVTVTYVTP